MKVPKFDYKYARDHSTCSLPAIFQHRGAHVNVFRLLFFNAHRERDQTFRRVKVTARGRHSRPCLLQTRGFHFLGRHVIWASRPPRTRRRPPGGRRTGPNVDAALLRGVLRLGRVRASDLWRPRPRATHPLGAVGGPFTRWECAARCSSGRADLLR